MEIKMKLKFPFLFLFRIPISFTVICWNLQWSDDNR